MYWTLDTRRPNLDEIIHEGAQRIRAAVEAVCARYDAPRLEVPVVRDEVLERAKRRASEDTYLALALSGRMLPGQYYEVSNAQQDIARQQRAALQNMNPKGLIDSPFCASAAQQGSFHIPRDAMGGLGLSVGCMHDLVMDATGTRVVRKRGPQYHKPESFGTLTEFH